MHGQLPTHFIVDHYQQEFGFRELLAQNASKPIELFQQPPRTHQESFKEFQYLCGLLKIANATPKNKQTKETLQFHCESVLNKTNQKINKINLQDELESN
jgi:hypothetical protein